ncbi:cytochrome P450 [Dulcicalothrix desertica]|nr:cytochrome P450 [Dulcicalothrix desertica]TWH42612.1 cytochrome P450 [Dulcicalothrix desertica PCC 7102]
MTKSIPVATPPTTTRRRSHTSAMNDDMLGYLEHLAQQGDFLRIPFGILGSGYFLNHPDLAQQVLLKQAKKFQKIFTVKYTAKGIFGENLFTSDGELWQVLRSIINPAFNAQRFNAYASIMTDYTKIMISQWQPGEVIDIPTAMMDLTLGITSRAFFGEDLRDNQIGQAIIKFIELFSQRISSFPVPIWIPIKSNLEMKRLFALIDNHVGSITVKRRQSGEDYGDILSMLIQAQASDTTGLLTNEQIRNEVLNLFAAGYEVTAHSIAFTLYLISQHPEVEARLLDEINQVVGDKTVTISNLNQMPYLEMVLFESMRLLPVTAVVSRQAIENVVIDDYIIPKNSLVLVAPWTLHRRSDYFPEPLRFDPDRFNSQHKDNIHKFAYLPFSGGPRICIGNAFATMQMRINIAMILQRFKLTSLSDYQLQPIFNFNTRPKNGLPMLTHARKGID